MRTANTIPDGRMDNDIQQTSPILSRMMLGKALRRLREEAGVSRESAGDAIRGSESKMSRLELGRTGFKLRDVNDLCTLYGVTDDAERANLLSLAQIANSQEWWHSYRDVIPSWFEAYLGMEQSASVIRTYEAQFVPGLLQTPAYADAVIRSGRGAASDDEIDRLVELRMRRQNVLKRRQPAHLWAILDEAALRRPFGGPDTMRGLLRHLIEACDMSHVTIQVLPFGNGGPAAEGAFTVLRLPDSDLPDVAYLEHLGAALYPDRPADLDYYRHWMNLLTTQADPATATQNFLHRLLSEALTRFSVLHARESQGMRCMRTPTDTKIASLGLSSRRTCNIKLWLMLTCCSPLKESWKIFGRESWEGNLAAGARLPSEHDLAQHYGTSRPTLRRAIARL